MDTSILTLCQLNSLIKNELKQAFPDQLWFTAEINSISTNRSGHAYLDLVEKSENGENIIASLRATIWAGVFRIIKPYFESVTGQPLHSGIKILARGQVVFHEVYGLSVNITDISPEYTVGEIAMQRKLTIQRLTDEGVIDLNKELALPMLVKNVAVISSSSAAGYGDFVKQLNNNPYGYKFNVYLFEAVVQGDEAPKSIISQLDRIAALAEHFHCIALIRGGGSKADLSCFDNFTLCQNLCQVPVPVITGIGHDRDQSVADMVANVALKTPTAVAQFIIDRAHNCDLMVDQLVENIKKSLRNAMERQQAKYNQLYFKITNLFATFSTRKLAVVDRVMMKIISNMRLILNAKSQRLDAIQNAIELQNPANILRKGYSYTMHNGKPVLSAKELTYGDTITTVFYNGSAESTVTKTIEE